MAVIQVRDTGTWTKVVIVELECPGGREERGTSSLVTKGKELILVNVY